MKGFVFSLDAILALGVTIGLIGLIGLHYTIVPQLRYSTIQSDAEDDMQILSGEVNVTKFNLPQSFEGETFLEAIGTMWLEGNKTRAMNLTRDALENFTTKCFELVFDNETIYKSCPNEGSTVAVANRMVSGYRTGEKPTGYIARIFLNKIRNVKSKFLYFGGYIGDGNITRTFNLTSMDNVVSVDMELAIGSNFSFYINDNYAGYYISPGASMYSKTYIVCNTTENPSYCSYLQNGINKIGFNFSGNDSYIGGGYVKIKYNTTEFSVKEPEKYYFPGIHGIINLYDSFYVPGKLNGMNIRLHYQSDYPVFLNIGGKNIYENDTKNENIIEITNESL
ncbi:MAG: hypothetical protein J7K87_00530, partial [Candidatus Aenigmarchaeota archaeon]|nr:hypothetical protein [Candidatus Aenigmarchaeota archaeon]